MTAWFNNLDKTIKIILLIPWWGWLISGIYRIVKYSENGNKNSSVLVIGILCLVIPFFGFIFSIIDLIAVASDKEISVMSD